MHTNDLITLARAREAVLKRDEPPAAGRRRAARLPRP